MAVKIKRSQFKSRPKTESGVPEVTLPTKPNVPSNRLFDYISLIYGEKKIGKTSMCAHFGKGFFAEFESGFKALPVHARLIRSWVEFKQYVRLIAKDDTFQYVVVDPVDKAYQKCSRFVCKNLGIDHPSDLQWGKGWSAVNEEFAETMDLLIASGKGIIFISHAAEKEIKTRTGEKYDIITATMSGSARDYMEGVVDIWGYYHYDGKERVLTIQGDDFIGAGHRLTTRFRYTDGTRVRHIPLGHSEKDAADAFVNAFENKLVKDVPSKKLVLKRK